MERIWERRKSANAVKNNMRRRRIIPMDGMLALGTLTWDTATQGGFTNQSGFSAAVVFHPVQTKLEITSLRGHTFRMFLDDAAHDIIGLSKTDNSIWKPPSILISRGGFMLG